MRIDRAKLERRHICEMPKTHASTSTDTLIRTSYRYRYRYRYRYPVDEINAPDRFVDRPTIAG